MSFLRFDWFFQAKAQRILDQSDEEAIAADWRAVGADLGAAMNSTARVLLVQQVSSIIGEVVHTALRKYVDSPESTVAWQAIRDMPDADWKTCCDIAAEQVVRELRDE
jgi:hypothetical protein